MRRFSYFIVVLVSIFAVAVPAQAATINVNSTADNLTAGDGNCTLREAIRNANTDSDTTGGDCAAGSGADTINVPAGTYTLTIAGQNENAAATGDLDITDSVTIQGAGATTTIIDGNDLDRIFHIHSGTVAINDLTVRNGTITTDALNAAVGGGISHLSSGTTTLNRLIVTGNLANGSGGGIDGCGGTLNVASSTVEDNTALARGGGISVGCGAQLSVTDSIVRDNSAGDHGGGLAQHIDPTTVTITNSTISGNQSNFAGGGIQSFFNLTITNSTISDNSSVCCGGGIFHTFGTLTMTNSTISGNRSQGGGGGADLAASGGIANLNNVTITKNTADEDADGTEGFGVPAEGGGVLQRGTGTVNFKNTIIAGNFDPTSAPDCFGTLNSQGHNLIQNTAGCTIAGDTTGNITGEDPKLGVLADNGGPTLTHALLFGSPAIDAGDPGTPGTGGTTCEATDQRGVARPVGAACDIGAFEGAQVHDLAVVKIKAPTTLKVVAGNPITESVQVQIQNRSPHEETVELADLGDGVTTGLVRLVVTAVDDDGEDCQEANVELDDITNAGLFANGPKVLKPKQKLTVNYLVTYHCVGAKKRDKSDGTPGDYAHVATVHHDVLDGNPDTHAADDTCPRSVTPPSEIDPNPDGTIKDQGCGTKKADKTFGDPVVTDVVKK